MSVQETNGYLDVENATLRSSKVEVTSNLGIANTNPQHAFSVGSNLFIDTESSNVLTIKGNVLTEGVKVGLIEIIPSYDFAAVSNVGNVTQSTIQFSNATTAFVTTANIEVGTANLFVDTVTGRVGIGKTDPGAALDVVGDVNATGSLTVSKDIESTNSFITERVLFKETWPNGHNSLIGDLGTWVVTNANQQSNPSITTTPDGYTHVSINGDDSANGEFVSPAFDLSDYAIVDGTLQADDKRKTTTRVFMKFWLGTRQLDASGEVVQVQFSPDNGSTWYTVATSQDRNNTDRFTMVSADLSPYILETSTNAKIRFYMPWTVAGGDYMRIGRIWIHESDVPTNLGGMWLGAGGNIGIGTTNPRVDLEIENVNGSPELRFTDPFSGGITNWGARSNVLGEISWYSRDSQFTDSYGKVASITSKHFDDGFPDGALCFTTSSNGVLNEDAMVIDQTGNVGIGTNNPFTPLHVRGTDCRLAIADSSSDDCDTNGFSCGIIFADNTWDGTAIFSGNPEAGMGFYLGHLSSSSKEINMRNLCGALSFGTRDLVQAMYINDSGNVGIGTNSPSSFFHVFRDAEFYGNAGDEDTHFEVGNAGEVVIERKNGSTLKGKLYTNMGSGLAKWVYYWTSGSYWQAGQSSLNVSGSNNADFKFIYTTTVKAYIDASDGVVEINFTGQHRTFIDGVPTSKSGDFVGLVVSANKNKYMKMSKGVEMGSNAITINESLPLVSLSTIAHDKACFGVISDAEDSETRKDSFGSLVTVSNKERGDTRVYINSVGEGAIWVTDINGPLESGDYITTSNVVGYGQKQDSEFLANYTVAKITMDCDFEPATQPVQIIRKETSNVNYWVKTTYENVSEEEYSNLEDENRQIIDGVYQKITNEESKTEEEGYELEVRQELVNVLDEHGQIQWEDTDETEKAYKIRYLDADGNITDEANHVYKAAFVGCTYHCG
jgi:hypothetical protein